MQHIHRQLASLDRTKEALTYLLEKVGVVDESDVLEIIKKDARKLNEGLGKSSSQRYGRMWQFLYPEEFRRETTGIPGRTFGRMSSRAGFLAFLPPETEDAPKQVPGVRWAVRNLREPFTTFPDAVQKTSRASRAAGMFAKTQRIAGSINKNAPGFLDKIGFILSIPEVLIGITDYCGTYEREKIKLEYEQGSYLRALRESTKHKGVYKRIKKEYDELDFAGKISNAEYMIQKWCPKEPKDVYQY